MNPTIPVDYKNITDQLETHFPTFTKIVRTVQRVDKPAALDFTNLTAKLRTLVVAILLLTFGASHAQAYEMFGKEAWNVGGNVDNPAYGRPRAGVYREDANNMHLLHSVHNGKYGKVYVNKTTGKCLIAHGGQNGALAGYWECNPNDPKMNWKLHHIGGGAYLFESLAYRNQCLDNPYRSHNGLVHLYRCNDQNYNQKFWRVQTHGGHQDGAPWQVEIPPAPSIPNLIRTGTGRDFPNQEVRRDIDGSNIVGGIYYVRFCNSDGNFSIRAKAQAEKSGGAPIADLELKYYAGYETIATAFGYRLATPAGGSWRQATKDFNYPGNDGNYDFWFWTPLRDTDTFSNTPVKFAIHTNIHKLPNVTRKVYDLGGIIDIGTVPKGTCRTYDKGMIYDN